MGRRIVTLKDSAAPAVKQPIADFDVPSSDVRDTGQTDPARLALSETADSFVQEKPDDYISRLVKFIPTELVTLYLFADGIMKSANSSLTFSWIIFFLLLALTPVYMWRITAEASKPPAWDHIVISVFSFALWVYVIGGPFASLSWYSPQYGSILAALFTVFVPVFRK